MNDDEKIFETIYECKVLLADKKKSVYFTDKLLSNTTLSTLNFRFPTLVKIRKPCGDVLPSRVSISSVGSSPAKKEREGR